MDIAVTGASGLIGTALTNALQADGHVVVPVVRRPVAAGERAVSWDPAKGQIDTEALNGVDAVVHLAGAGIGDKRWSDERKRVILESRTKGTALLAEALASLDDKPPVLVSGSAVGYYGDGGDTVLTEQSPPGNLFLSEVCVAWEAAVSPAVEAGIRVPIIRTGIVLSTDGGALAKTLPLFKLGLGGKMGSGRQWWSWISLADEVAAIRFLLHADVDGPVNLTAPNPVTNAQFTKALGQALGRPTVVPVPSFGPKLLLGSQLADELLFFGQRVEPSRLAEAGFAFAHPTIEKALTGMLGS
jgi:uncharacterized protein (TIGR01777 family)